MQLVKICQWVNNNNGFIEISNKWHNFIVSFQNLKNQIMTTNLWVEQVSEVTNKLKGNTTLELSKNQKFCFGLNNALIS